MTERGKRPVQSAIDSMAKRSRGILPRGVHTAASRMAEIHISDVSKLPVVEGVDELENGSGQNIFLLGYSKVGGPDVLG